MVVRFPGLVRDSAEMSYSDALLRRTCAVMMVACTLLAASANGDVFNMPAGQTSVTMLTVGDPGNAPDSYIAQISGFPASWKLGEVDYVYSIDKYEVTNAQYCQFLNAKLPTISDPWPASGSSLPSDTYGLYYLPMGSDPHNGGISYDPNASVGQKFSPVAGRANWPVGYVPWCDAMRFANWLQNGQGDGATESGTYQITGGSLGSGVVAYPDPRAGALPAAGHWVLTNQNEWYKAAYYKGGGTNSGYWYYPTQTGSRLGDRTPPSSWSPALTTEPANSANYNGPSSNDNGSLIDVGSYPLSLGPYGTLDQGGNATEWTETVTSPQSLILRGGSYAVGANLLASDARNQHFEGPLSYFGFRVAYVPSSLPEPSTLAILSIGASGITAYTMRRWRRQRGKSAGTEGNIR